MPNVLEITRSSNQNQFIILSLRDGVTGVTQTLGFRDTPLLKDPEYAHALVMDKVWTWFGLWSFTLRGRP